MKSLHIFVGVVTLLGCAIETGNPKKPRPGDNDELRATADIHVRQAIEIATDKNQSAGTTSLKLSGDNEVQYTCDKAENGITSKKNVKTTSNFTSPDSNPVWKIDLEQTFVSTTSWSASPSDAVLCSSENIPTIVYQKVSSIDINKNLEQNTSRTVKRYQDESIAQEDRIKKAGDIKMTLSKGDSSAENISLNSSSTFSIATEYSVDKKDGNPLNLKTTITTPSSAPIRVNKQADDRGNISKTVIVSGAVNSTNSAEQKVESTFNNVEIDTTRNCIPVSGTVSGKIYDPNDADTPLSSYSLSFSGSTANITYPDGSIEEILISGCGLF